MKNSIFLCSDGWSLKVFWPSQHLIPVSHPTWFLSLFTQVNAWINMNLEIAFYKGGIVKLNEIYRTCFFKEHNEIMKFQTGIKSTWSSTRFMLKMCLYCVAPHNQILKDISHPFLSDVTFEQPIKFLI